MEYMYPMSTQQPPQPPQPQPGGQLRGMPRGIPIAVSAPVTAHASVAPPPSQHHPELPAIPQRGVVKRFYPEKGFGFLFSDEGPELFFHTTSCSGFAEGTKPEFGDVVLFTKGFNQRSKKIEAFSVQLQRKGGDAVDALPRPHAAPRPQQPRPAEALRNAARANDTEAIAALIAGGGPDAVHAHSADTWQTALHVACACGAFQAAQLLIAAGASVIAGDRFNLTPLHAACQLSAAAPRGAPASAAAGGEGGGGRGGETDAADALVALLLKSGADVFAPDAAGATPLHYAAALGSPRILRALVASLETAGGAGAAARNMLLSARDDRGDTALHYALKFGAAANVECLDRELAAPKEPQRPAAPELGTPLAPLPPLSTPCALQQVHVEIPETHRHHCAPATRLVAVTCAGEAAVAKAATPHEVASAAAVAHLGGHPHVVRVLGRAWGSLREGAEPRELVVMEAAEGSLREEMRALGGGAAPPDATRVALVALQVADALRHMHGANLQHLNFSTGNGVLLFEGGRIAKLGCFVAQQVAPTAALPSSDVYCLGALLWRWLSAADSGGLDAAEEQLSLTVARGTAFPELRLGKSLSQNAGPRHAALAALVEACTARAPPVKRATLEEVAATLVSQILAPHLPHGPLGGSVELLPPLPQSSSSAVPARWRGPESTTATTAALAWVYPHAAGATLPAPAAMPELIAANAQKMRSSGDRAVFAHLLGFVEQPGRTIVLRELLPGEQLLRELLQLRAPLEPLGVARVARDVAAALSALHAPRADAGDAAGQLLHLQLCPESVIVLGAGEAAKLADAGAAARGIQPFAFPSYVPGSVFGLARVGGSPRTRVYRAPEQLSQAQPLGPAADVYALGVIMWELLTGRQPWASQTTAAGGVPHEEELVRWLLDEQVDLVRGCGPAVAAAASGARRQGASTVLERRLARIVARCVRLTAAARPSADALHRELAEVAEMGSV